MLLCPDCGFAEVQLVGPSYYECHHVHMVQFTEPTSGRPVSYSKRCGNLFQTPADDSYNLPLCVCGIFFATATCLDCRRFVCDRHQHPRGEQRVCYWCVHRMDATAASEMIRPFHHAMQVMRDTENDVERLIRWSCLSHVDEYLKSGLAPNARDHRQDRLP